MNETIILTYDAVDGVYIATVPEFGTVNASGATVDEAFRNVRIALKLWTEHHLTPDGERLPLEERIDQSLTEVIRLFKENGRVIAHIPPQWNDTDLLLTDTLTACKAEIARLRRDIEDLTDRV